MTGPVVQLTPADYRAFWVAVGVIAAAVFYSGVAAICLTLLVTRR